MSEEQIYGLLVWGIPAAGGLVLLAVAVYVIARFFAPEFPEDDGERM